MPRRGVEVAVAVSQPLWRAADDSSGDGDPLALPPESLVAASQLVGQADSQECPGKQPVVAPEGGAGVEEAVGDVVEDALVLGRKNC